MDMHEIQLAATKEAMSAKRNHEIEVATRRVDSLAQQVYERTSRLMDLASDIRYQSGRATDEPVRFPFGAFGRDAETLDEMVKALSEESQDLATMRVAADTTDEMQGRYEALIREEVEKGEGDADQPSLPMMPGVEVGVGTYL